MRILHLTAGSDAGGVSRYIFDLCTAMQAAGHEVVVAGECADCGTSGLPRPHGLGSKCRSKADRWDCCRAVRILRKYLAEHPVDILHAHFRKAAIVGRKLQKQGRPPPLYTLHGSHIPLNGVWGWLSDFGDHVHVPSVEARQWLIDEAGVAADRITLIPHGIHLERFPVPDEATWREREPRWSLARTIWPRSIWGDWSIRRTKTG